MKCETARRTVMYIAIIDMKNGIQIVDRSAMTDVCIYD